MSMPDPKPFAWLLMLIPFTLVVGIGTFFVFCAYRRRPLEQEMVSDEEPELEPASGPNLANAQINFLPDRPNRWLAIQCSNPDKVQAALNLLHPTRCSWEEGLDEGRKNALFISPPVSGWVLVLGDGLPDPAEEVDRCHQFLAGLSRKLGHLQFYSVNRVLSHHAWALVEDGVFFRAYAWAGGTIWNQGIPTAAEKDLRIRTFDYGSEPDLFLIRESLAANTERVSQLASCWSVDPLALSHVFRATEGIMGRLSPSGLR